MMIYVFPSSTDQGYWTSWEGECDVTCGYGYKIRTRKCVGYDYIDYYGCPVYCEGLDTDHKPCEKDCCPRKNT